jgi:hypothetical protein
MPVNCGRRVTASDGAAGPIKWGFWRLHRPQAEGPAYFPETPYFVHNGDSVTIEGNDPSYRCCAWVGATLVSALISLIAL